MNILICDDMQSETEMLADLINKSEFNTDTVLFNTGHDAFEYILTGAIVDACFLDIVMPEMNGITLAEQLREKNYTGKIVFLTTSNEYAHESYRVKAFDYLLKPPTPESVRNVLRELENVHINNDTSSIHVKISGVSRNIFYRDISHVEVIDHYVYFRLTNGENIQVFSKFSEIAKELLFDLRFIQCHRSFIVNMHDIATITDKDLTIRNGTNIPVSRSYPETKSIYFKWKFGLKENEQ